MSQDHALLESSDLYLGNKARLELILNRLFLKIALVL